MGRARTEYRLSLPAQCSSLHGTGALDVRGPTTGDRGAAARLLLDAYRGTIDDEGESEEDALAAIDYYLAVLDPRCSFVLSREHTMVALSFVVVVDGLPYIDPVATSSAQKRTGLGSVAVCASLSALESEGAREVGAVITDGNLPSQRLFESLGFVRHGAWER